MDVSKGIDIGRTKYIFLGGKGGVGKTVMAGAIAVESAQQGKQVLLASLNPVHSLSTLFMQNVSGGRFCKIEGVEGLTVVEVEISDLLERYRVNMEARLNSSNGPRYLSTLSPSSK